MSSYKQYRAYLLAHADKLEHRRVLKRIYAKKYRMKYKDLIIKRLREWRKNHPGKCTEYHRRYKEKMMMTDPEKYARHLLHYREKSQRWKELNPFAHRRTAPKRRNAHREFLSRSKMKPCVDCGIQYNPWIMQFDHRDPEKKSFGLGGFMRHQVGMKRLIEEVKKCDVVCANCHSERTHKQRLAGLFRPIRKSVLSNQ